jgi:hypothetical protein
MAGEMNLDTHWQETLAAALAAAGENRTPVLGFHACAESELLLARALGWLVCAFHKKSIWLFCRKEAKY